MCTVSLAKLDAGISATLALTIGHQQSLDADRYTPLTSLLLIYLLFFLMRR